MNISYAKQLINQIVFLDIQIIQNMNLNIMIEVMPLIIQNILEILQNQYIYLKH